MQLGIRSTSSQHSCRRTRGHHAGVESPCPESGLMEHILFTTRFASEPVESESDNRVIGGLAVPFGTDSSPTLFDGEPRIHRFERGAFARSIKERFAKIRLKIEHEHKQLPIGKPLELTETDEGLFSRFEIANTAMGNDALTLVRDGFVDAFSVGISPLRWTDDGERVIHGESRVDEVSLVSSPAFAEATAQAFSTTSQGMHPDIARRRLRLLESETSKWLTL